MPASQNIPSFLQLSLIATVNYCTSTDCQTLCCQTQMSYFYSHYFLHHPIKQKYYNYPHFTDEKSEVRRGHLTCPRPMLAGQWCELSSIWLNLHTSTCVTSVCYRYSVNTIGGAPTSVFAFWTKAVYATLSFDEHHGGRGNEDKGVHIERAHSLHKGSGRAWPNPLMMRPIVRAMILTTCCKMPKPDWNQHTGHVQLDGISKWHGSWGFPKLWVSVYVFSLGRSTSFADKRQLWGRRVVYMPEMHMERSCNWLFCTVLSPPGSGC